MNSFSQLPVECLECIIHYILSVSDFKKGHPLASLCQVNKRICNIATRFLYQNPRPLFHIFPFNQDRNPRSRQLLQTLISNIPTHNLHPAVILGLGIDSNYNDASNSNNNTLLHSVSGLNHLSLTRSIEFRTIKYTDYDAQGNHRDYTTAELDYINGQEFLEMYLTDRKDATCVKDPHSMDCLLRYYPNVVYREAIWSLAEPIFEQLECLSFLVSDLRRYYNNIGRLEKLEQLIVRFDLEFNCNCCSRTPEAEPRRQRKEETLRLLVQFVKDHMKRFPGRLKSFQTYQTGYCRGSQFCPRAVQDELYHLIRTV
ncbi:hypothetical protein BGZ95_002219 [Linnemannia exigua]|uniref:F-box domain-containing protein n=1 Tax=Linnemannia exigua TaxID=604196 RepID=A0AAD4D5S4_9FUNG|nr:hypothetical protein BGZ95_002219 [Linnemannia exigua]